MSSPPFSEPHIGATVRPVGRVKARWILRSFLFLFVLLAATTYGFFRRDLQISTRPRAHGKFNSPDGMRSRRVRDKRVGSTGTVHSWYGRRMGPGAVHRARSGGSRLQGYCSLALRIFANTDARETFGAG